MTVPSSSDASASPPHFLVTIPQRTDRSRLLVGDDTASASTLASVSKSLRFKTPRDAEDGSYLCTAALAPGSKRLHVCATNASIKSVTDGVSKTRKITVNLSKDQARQFMALDAVVLDYVKLHVEQWFDGKMDDALVEEYYRPTVVADSGNGVCAKLHVVSKGLPKDLREGDHSLRLQLLGIQFRKQHFTLVWKYVDRAVPPPPEEDASDAGQVKQAEQEDDDEDDEDVKSALMYSGERETLNHGGVDDKKKKKASSGDGKKKSTQHEEHEEESAATTTRKSGTAAAARKSSSKQQQQQQQTLRSRDERGAETTIVTAEEALPEDRHQDNGGDDDDDKKPRSANEYDFVSEKEDDEGKVDDDCEEDDVPGPSWDEYEQMRARLLDDIDAHVSRVQERLEKLKTARGNIESAKTQDMKALENGTDLLDTLNPE